MRVNGRKIEWRVTHVNDLGEHRRKPRKAGRLQRLSDQQKALLKKWLLDENLSYLKIKHLVQDQFGITVSSALLSEYYSNLGQWKGKDSAETLTWMDLATRLTQVYEFHIRLVPLTGKKGG